MGISLQNDCYMYMYMYERMIRADILSRWNVRRSLDITNRLVQGGMEWLGHLNRMDQMGVLHGSYTYNWAPPPLSLPVQCVVASMLIGMTWHRTN